jgi:hypothetical protein
VLGQPQCKGRIFENSIDSRGWSSTQNPGGESESETDTDTTNGQWTHLQVIAKVVDSSAGSRSSEMVIEPSEEDILRGKLQKTRHVFTLLQQDDQLRMVLERNLGEKLDLDNLPQEAEDEDGTASA